MKRVWLVYEGGGEYDDAWTEPVCVCASEELADKTVREHKKKLKDAIKTWEKWDSENEYVGAEYMTRYDQAVEQLGPRPCKDDWVHYREIDWIDE